MLNKKEMTKYFAFSSGVSFNKVSRCFRRQCGVCFVKADYKPGHHSNHNIDSIGFKPFTVISKVTVYYYIHVTQIYRGKFIPGGTPINI